MKAIMVMFDTLNRLMLPPYGCDWVHAPNFQRLAERSVTFERYYVGSMPCMPARRELHTGRYNFLHRGWGPLEPFDDSMPEYLRRNGVYTHLVTDHQHYFEDGGATYHNRYSSWEYMRGQEGDLWKGHVGDPYIPPVVVPRDPTMGESYRMWRQDWINRGYLQKEEDQPQAHVFQSGIEFIRTNAKLDRWFLQIETFDPHEPYFTQQHYKDLYPHQYEGKHFDWPPYRRVQESADEVQHIRYEYAALLSMCDAHLGKILDLMDELDLWQDTLLIVNTDHGFLLGEHDWWAKNVQPMYEEISHPPLFIWDPREPRPGARCDALVQMIDMPATLLEYFDLPLPKDVAGKPLRQALASNTPVREVALFGTHGGHVNITDGRYVYMRTSTSSENLPLYDYTLMPTHMRSRFRAEELQEMQLAGPFDFTKGCQVMKLPARGMTSPHEFGNLLFDLQNDPQQMHPIQDNAIEERMIRLMVELMQQNDAPAEQYVRLGLEAYLPSKSPVLSQIE